VVADDTVVHGNLPISVGRTEGEELTSLQKSIVETPFMLRI
jgi:hypothetical protein